MATYALDVIARIEKYQRRFAQIPGFTDKEAAKAAKAFEQRMTTAQEKVVQAAERASREAAKAQARATREVAAEQKRAAAEALAAQEALSDKVRRLSDEVERVKVGDDWFNAKKQVAELDALEAELRQLGKLTKDVQSNIDARKWQILGGLGQKVEQSTTAASRGLGKMSRGLSAVGMQIPDVLSQLQSGTPIFTILTQQGLQVVQMLDIGMATLKRYALALGIAGVAAAAAAYAYHSYQKEQERLNRIQAVSAKIQQSLKERGEALRNTTIDLKVAVGELTEKEGELLKMRRQAFVESLPSMQELTASLSEQSLKVEELEKAYAAANEKAKTWNQSAEVSSDLRGKAVGTMNQEEGAVRRLSAELATERRRLIELEDSRDALATGIRKQVQANEELVNAQEEATKKEERRAEALARLTEQQEKLRAAADRWRGEIQDAEGVMQKHYRLLAEIIDLERKGALTAQEAAGARLVVHQQTQKAIAEEKKAEADLARERVERAEQARRTIEDATAHRLSAVQKVALEEQRALAELQKNDQATQEQITALREEYARRRIEAADEEAKKVSEKIREQLASSMQMAGDLFGSVFSLAMEAADFDGQIQRQGEAIGKLQKKLADGEETLSKAQKKQIKEQIKARREAARAAFEAQQKAAKAEAIINGILAASYALTLGPIAGPIYAATAAAAAATQVQAIENQKPPKFHTGTGQVRPDETWAVLQRDEGVLTRRGVDAAGGPEAVDRLNRGAPVGSGPLVIQQVYRHRVLDEVIQDHLRQPTGLRRATIGQTNRGRVNPYARA